MSIAVKQKDKVFGETFNVGELLEALRDKAFKEEYAPISLHTQYHQGKVVAIYECKDCDRLHILGNNYSLNDEQEISDFAENEEDVYELVSVVAKKIHIIDMDIYKNKMIDVLEKIDHKKKVVIETIIDMLNDNDVYTLTGAYKCSEECPAIHLDSAYSEATFSKN